MNRFIGHVVIATFIILGLYSVIAHQLFFPSDILRTIPQYGTEVGWQRTENSLLSDPVFQFEPWRDYAKKRLLSGEIPFMNSQNALGSPFFANQINAVFYPLTLLYYVLPLSLSLLFVHILKIFLMYLFSYLYFRSIGIAKHVSSIGGFLLAVSGFVLVWLLWPQTNVYVLFPLLLYITEKTIQAKNSKSRWNILLAVVYFFAILGGHPETLFHIGILNGFYILFRYKNLKQTCISYGYIVLGFGLSAFQLLPFLEYLAHSYMLMFRLEEVNAFYLPKIGFLLNSVPFLFGAPHLDFYKPLWQETNFQEMIGGYVGPSVLVLGLVAMFKLKKTSIIRFWISVAVVSFGVSYAIPVFTFINRLPVFNTSANHRFIAFFGFSLIVLSVIFISKIIQSRRSILNSFSRKFLVLSLLLIGVLFIVFPIPFLHVDSYPFIRFFVLLKSHIGLLFISSSLFFWFFHWYGKKASTVALVGIFMSLFFQTLFFFLTYNPFTKQELYYPDTTLTKAIQNLPDGVFLEIGNPTLTENINLMYDLSSIENYDALEIATFKKRVDDVLLEKNQWGNRETVTQDALDEFGISYVISDYDVRYEKVDIVSKRDNVSKPFLKGQDISISLETVDSVRGIRLLPATYNRVNNCEVYVSLVTDSVEVEKRTLLCSQLFNNMYYTVSFLNPLLQNTDSSHIVLSTNATQSTDAVSFYGDGIRPYVSIISNELRLPTISLVKQTSDWFLFMNINARFAENDGTVQLVKEAEEHISLLVDQKKDGVLEVKRAYYPGWEVFVDKQKRHLVDAPLLTTQLTKGVHIVDFIYIPNSFYIGLYVSLISLSLLLLSFSKDIYNGITRSDEK